MKKLDAFEKDILDAYEKGELKTTSPSKARLAKFKAAATATFLKRKADQHSSVCSGFNGYSSASTRRRYAIPDVNC